MSHFLSSSLRSTGALTLCLAAMIGQANAQEAGAYASEKGICKGDPSALILITEGHIDGPGFDCAYSNFTPAGSGLVNYDGVCTIDGATVTGPLTFDLGNFEDHYEVSIPNAADWLALYPCTGTKK